MTNGMTDERTDGASAVREAARNMLADMVSAGQMLKYLYSFKAHGKMQQDLNVDGLNRLAIACGASIQSRKIISEDNNNITVQAIAMNEDGFTHHGLVQEEKRTGYVKPNRYALENNVSKAKRNTKKGLLPMADVREAISKEGCREHT